MFEFGAIVLTRFPFTDLSGAKRRPALVISRYNDRRQDLVVCFITSRPQTGPDVSSLEALPGTGLKLSSFVRFDKIATLERDVIVGTLGDAPSEWLQRQCRIFFGVFGFDPPSGER